jgi:hypothetical protein
MIALEDAALKAARAYVWACADRLWDATVSRTTPSLDDITAVWTAAHQAVGVARTAVDATYAAAGTSALYTACPLERAHRDMHAMLRHLVAQPLWLEDAGRVLLGSPATHPLYAV